MRLFKALSGISLIFFFASLSLFGQTGTGKLKAKVNPGRAGVFVDGKYVGPAANFGKARTYAVAPGEHELKLVEPRYEDITKKVSVEAGKTLVVSESMKPLDKPKAPFGLLRVRGLEKFSGVFLNNKFMAHEDEVNNCAQGLKVAPGEYLVKVVDASGNMSRENKIQIKDSAVTTLLCSSAKQGSGLACNF